MTQHQPTPADWKALELLEKINECIKAKGVATVLTHPLDNGALKCGDPKIAAMVRELVEAGKLTFRESSYVGRGAVIVTNLRFS